ncbi:ANTAR domain-containing response regulator [Treponema pectinovorum]|uniref:ANTAR domain-containing response regulator n=1 Tax=Treponema pectinovorum TaxID=164 RepID=UPI0011C8CF27|nr:ANTAR domain-containing protein [Treponema pectinovorum]
MTWETYSVLVVAKDIKNSTLMHSILVQPTFEVIQTTDFNEARRLCSERVFNIVIVEFLDGSGTEFAIDISSHTSSILLIAPVQIFDQISYSVEPYGILTIKSPFDSFYFYNMIKIAVAVQYKVKLLSSQTVKLKEKMEEIRLVNRAKMLLMQKDGFTEQQAHRYIEKQAMDKSQKRLQIAEEIIKNYT